MSEPTQQPATGQESGPAQPKWIDLTEEQARAHPLWGAGGWLIVLSLYMLLSAGAYLIVAFAFHELPGVRRLVAIAMGILAGIVLVTLGTFKRSCPYWLIAYFVAQIGISFLFNAHIWALIPPLVCIPYVLFSKRVNITYRRRARPKWLEQAAAAHETTADHA